MTFDIRIEGSEVVFKTEAGKSILDAAEKHGIELPYSCRKGVCGNCRGRVLAGKLLLGTGGGSHETGINAPDEHLFCRAEAATDLLILPRTWRRIDPDARKTLPATVFRNQRVADDVSMCTCALLRGRESSSKQVSTCRSCCLTETDDRFPWPTRRTKATAYNFTSGTCPMAGSHQTPCLG